MYLSYILNDKINVFREITVKREEEQSKIVAMSLQ